MKPLRQKINAFLSNVYHNPLYIRYGIIVFPVLSVLVALIIISTVTIPQVFKLIHVNEDIKVLENKEAAYQAKITTLESININQYKQDLEDVLYFLPADKDIPGAISSIFDLVSKSGLQLDNVDLGASANEGNLHYINVTADVSGSTEQIQNLINLAPQSSRMIKITGIAVNNLNNDSSAAIDMAVFFAPLETASAAAADLPVSLLSQADNTVLQEIQQNIQAVKNSNQPTTSSEQTGKTDPFN